MAAIIWQWLARIRQSATLVFLVQARKKRIPCALRWTANDPGAWEKAVGALESLVLIGETRWLFLVSWRALQMRTRHVENARRIRSSAILKAQLHCATTAAERETVQSSLVAETKGSRSTETSGFSAGSMRGETVSSATEAWQSLQQAESILGRNLRRWPSEVSNADIFEIKVQADRELQLKAKNERILGWRRAWDNGAQEIEGLAVFGQVEEGQVEPGRSDV